MPIHTAELREKILESIIFAMQFNVTKRDGSTAEEEIRLTARINYMNDLVFHHAAEISVREIMLYISIGE